MPFTLRQWVEHWISIGCPGSKRRREVGQRSIERYAELLRHHALPTLGERPLQQLRSTEIDTLYVTLADKISARTALHVHSVLNACLGAATRTRQIARNPMRHIVKVPCPGEPDHGIALDQDELRKLLEGFKGLSLFPIVAVAAFTGARRGEILALQWDYLDIDNKILRIERAIDDIDKHGLRIKGPKTERGKRTIIIDDDLISLLATERERHLRLVAGVPDGAAVDLSLAKLPPGALIFPSPGDDLTKPRHPRAITKEFAQRAKRLGFTELRFHDLRGTHKTLLLDAGVPVHTVAARCGHDPAVMCGVTPNELARQTYRQRLSSERFPRVGSL